jgi:hypothetical protein
MNSTYLHVGGLVALGFDSTSKFLLVVSHSGRGVYSTDTWEKVGRDPSDAYPENGMSIGIPPIDGERIAIEEIDYETGELCLVTPDKKFILHYCDGMIEVRRTPT